MQKIDNSKMNVNPEILINNEPPLDPVLVKLRTRLMRLMFWSITIFLLFIILTIFAIFQKTKHKNLNENLSIVKAKNLEPNYKISSRFRPFCPKKILCILDYEPQDKHIGGEGQELLYDLQKNRLIGFGTIDYKLSSFIGEVQNLFFIVPKTLPNMFLKKGNYYIFFNNEKILSFLEVDSF